MRIRVLREITLIIGVFAAIISQNPQLVSAQVEIDSGTIAFVRPNNATGDEIWLIQPDGSNERRIWAVGEADPSDVHDISDVDWRSDAGAIAFASNHESACSIFDSDIYTINADGNSYRRVTNGPTCAELAGYPTGSVTVTIYNFSQRGPFFVYVQGSPELQMITVPQANSATVTFSHVADFGDALQQAVVIEGSPNWRYVAPIAAADVRPGETVHAGTINVVGDGIQRFGAYIPSWHRDGTQLGYILGECASMYRIPADSAAGSSGEALLNEENGYVFPCVMDWGPATKVADQLLYYSYLEGGIFQVTQGSNDGGTKLVSTEGYEIVYDLQWQPDGSGFLFTKKTFDDNFVDNANLFAYSFASNTVIPLTNFTGEFVRDVSISPDGQRIVFERSATQEFEEVDLYVMRWDGSERQLLIENGRLPSWSQQTPQVEVSQPYFSGIANFVNRIRSVWEQVFTVGSE